MLHPRMAAEYDGTPLGGAAAARITNGRPLEILHNKRSHEAQTAQAYSLVFMMDPAPNSRSSASLRHRQKPRDARDCAVELAESVPARGPDSCPALQRTERAQDCFKEVDSRPRVGAPRSSKSWRAGISSRQELRGPGRLESAAAIPCQCVPVRRRRPTMRERARSQPLIASGLDPDGRSR